jgi:hypothetical protein
MACSSEGVDPSILVRGAESGTLRPESARVIADGRIQVNGAVPVSFRPCQFRDYAAFADPLDKLPLTGANPLC